MHVKINQPSGMPRNEKGGPKRPYKPPLPQTCQGYAALMTLITSCDIMSHFMHVILYSGGRTLTSDLKVSFWRF